MSHVYFLRRKKFRLEKKNFLPKKYIFFITYRNEHPVYIKEQRYKKRFHKGETIPF